MMLSLDELIRQLLTEMAEQERPDEETAARIDKRVLSDEGKDEENE